MPNTLAHLGIQGFLTRTAVKNADPKLVFIGCIIPDFPWILQRVVRWFDLEINPYDLRLYVIIQASLCFCLIFSALLSVFFADVRKTFTIFGISSFLHLFLDALQTKWANGVHFFAPFDWRLTNIGLFWPESRLTILLMGFGLIYVLGTWRQSIAFTFHFPRPSFKRLFLLILLAAVYFFAPLSLLPFPEREDNHFIGTLRFQELRTGKPVEFDRNRYSLSTTAPILETFAGEDLKVTGLELDHSASVSARGIFVDSETVQIDTYHVHAPSFRDSSSYVGLALVLALCVHTIIHQYWMSRWAK